MEKDWGRMMNRSAITIKIRNQVSAFITVFGGGDGGGGDIGGGTYGVGLQ